MRMSLRRRVLTVTAVVSFAVLLVPQAAFAGKPRFGCSPGFDLGALTVEQAIQLPNSQAGLADGVFSLEQLHAGFDSLDRNDDGVICFKSFSPNANPASLLQYSYNTVDNNTSVPSG